MARPTLSPHCLAKDLQRGRRFAFSVLEGFLLSLLTLFCFSISGYIDPSIPLYSSASSSASSCQKELTSLILSSGAGEASPQGGLLSYSERSENYLKGTALSALVYYSLPVSGLYYQGVSAMNEESDKAYSYLVVYKPSHSEQFSSLSFSGASSYWEKMKDVQDYFESGEGYPVLKKEIAASLDEAIRNPSYEPGKEIAIKLQESYHSLLKEVAEDFQASSLDYKASFSAYEEARDFLYRYKFVESFLCHILSCLLYFFAFTFLVKGGQTLGRRILKAELLTKDGFYPSWWQKLLRGLLLFVETLLIPSCLPLFTYGASAAELFVTPLLGPFSLLFFSLFSVCFLILDFSFCFFTSHKTPFSELLFRLRSVDGREE